MPVKISTSQFNEGIIFVNGKEVYKDTNGKWIARTELTYFEYETFKTYLEILGETID